MNDVASRRSEAVQALLRPISESLPAGEDLLFSNDFDVIQEARRFEDPSLDQGEWVTEIKEADWDLVISRATALLSTQTKDLRLAVWLTEAWGLKDGLAGLTQGYALLDGLCAEYWDSFHPLPEEGDQDYRLGNVGWLSGRTAELLRGIALTNGGAGRFGALDWEVATNLVQAVKRDPDNADDILRGKVTIDAFDAARRATKPSFYTQVLRELAAFERAYKGLETTLDARAGDDAPSFRQVKEAYETVRRLAERFARDAGIDPAGALEGTPAGDAGAPSADAPTATPSQTGGAYERIEPQFDHTETDSMGQLSVVSNGTPGTSPSPTLSGGAAGPITSRSQAIVRLREIAAFFRRTEPHSPAAYMAEKAAVWADMPLHEWLNAVVKDGASLEQLNDMLGVKKIDE
ncbi:type VI secretion system protein TssA [Robbsia sp. KACC 23696]|uniref:type VI secretion system protein TssA n=1 Tax=Robbsia sp. KACC 23696 TaxID=3149231 RepID=UPI00325C178E